MSNLPEKIDMLEKVGELHLRSYKPTEIAQRLGISPAQAKSYIADYQSLVQRRVENDPDFLDRVAENTFEAIERLNELVREAWETYETAKDNDMINQQINLLKVFGDFEEKRSKLLQLMGAKTDSGMMARMQRAEKVNEIVSRVIKEIVGDCPKCRAEVMPRLAEAFELMNRSEEAVDMREHGPSFIDAEVIEEEDDDHDHDAMIADIIDPNM